MTKTSGKPAYAVPVHVVYQDVDGQMVLLNLESEQYFGLNGVGANIVSRLTQEPFDHAFSNLLSDYEVDEQLLLRDVQNLVDALIGAGLLTPVESPD